MENVRLPFGNEEGGMLSAPAPPPTVWERPERSIQCRDGEEEFIASPRGEIWVYRSGRGTQSLTYTHVERAQP